MKRVLFFICITLISMKCYCTFCGDIPKPKNVISENTLPPEDDDSQFEELRIIIRRNYLFIRLETEIRKKERKN